MLTVTEDASFRYMIDEFATRPVDYACRYGDNVLSVYLILADPPSVEIVGKLLDAGADIS